MELQEEITKTLLDINEIWQGLLIQRQAAAGLVQDTMLYAKVLNYLRKNEDREVFQKDIEKDEGLNKSTVSMLLSNMEKQGLLERRNVERDARLKQIVMTPKGEEICDNVIRSLVEIDHVCYQGLSEMEEQQMLSLLRVIEGNLKNLAEQA